MPDGTPMKILINQREADYIPDYPDGWKFSAGDPFKFPVMIGGNSCFIKRFEQKSPDDISGWKLMVELTGKYEKNLARVYDIKNVKENGKEIYYVFYEYLDGFTLDKAVKESSVNLIHLNNDLFNALRALQKYAFWFADFFEKNIFRQKDGTFVLVDLDSTQRITDLPDNEMYGSKDYWILVLKFCKEVLNKDDLRLSDINGISLNYLQIPFLILRQRMFSEGGGEDYNASDLFNQLPSRLNEMAPELSDIYSTVIRNGKRPLSEEDTFKIEDIVEQKIIRAEYIPGISPSPATLPVIKAFTTSTGEIPSGGTFTLSWQTENAGRLELYKNGAKFKTLEANQSHIELKEFADGTRQQSSYQLVAYKDLDMAKSDPIIITLSDSEPAPAPKPRPPVVIGGIILLVLIIGAFFLFTKDRKAASGELPVADAGPDQSITLPDDAVLLAGSGTQANGTIQSYQWTKVSGPSTGVITDAGSASTSVKGLVKGVYQFQLTVTGNGAISASDIVQVTVNESANKAPVANAVASPPAITLPQNAVTLIGNGSDADGAIASYEWTKISGPNDPNIINRAQQNTVANGLIAGSYVFRLTVTDNLGTQATNEVTVAVHAAANIRPTANAGPSQTRIIGPPIGPIQNVAITLAGSGADADGTISRYQWTGPGRIISPNSPSTRVENLGVGTHKFTLTVTDNDGATGASTVQIFLRRQPTVPDRRLEDVRPRNPAVSQPVRRQQ